MEAIRIAETKTSPSVIFDFDNNEFEITGCSRPEDVVAFYGPIINWLTNLKKNINDDLIAYSSTRQLVFKIYYDYFNSSSAKYVLDLVLLIDDIYKKGLNVKIEWYYKSDDEDMLETGQEFTDLIKCPIDFTAV